MDPVLMPFKSQKQRAFMYSRHPEIAKRWRKESGPQKGLPERTGRSTRREQLVRQFLKKQKRHG
jgi:hypothetical protein